MNALQIEWRIWGWNPLKFAIVLLGAAVLPFSAIIFHFLVQGAYFLDSGWFAFLLSQSDSKLSNPPALGAGSYLATHVSPSFWPFIALSRALDLKPYVSFALWQSLIFIATALTGLRLVGTAQGCEKSASGVWAFLAVFLLPFSGLSLAILNYPHTEAMGMSILFLCLVLWTDSRDNVAKKNSPNWINLIAWVLFVFALGVREDMGFHGFALIMTFLVLAKLFGRPPASWRTLLVAALIGFLFSIAAIIFQKANYTGDNAFARIYSGEPPWAHLSLKFFTTRVGDFLIKKPYLSAPMIVCAFYALKRRNPLLAVPLLAFLPWMVVNLSASAQAAGTLMGYYAYPLLALFVWPLFMLRFGKLTEPETESKKLIVLCAVMLILSIGAFRSSNGKRLFLAMNPLQAKLLFDGSFQRINCQVTRFLKNGGSNAIVAPQYAALLPGSLTKAEAFIEPNEAAGKDYILVWKDSYGEDRLKEEPGIKNNYEKIYGDTSVAVIWKRKATEVRDVAWAEVFAPCDL